MKKREREAEPGARVKGPGIALAGPKSGGKKERMVWQRRDWARDVRKGEIYVAPD